MWCGLILSFGFFVQFFLFGNFSSFFFFLIRGHVGLIGPAGFLRVLHSAIRSIKKNKKKSTCLLLSRPTPLTGVVFQSAEGRSQYPGLLRRLAEGRRVHCE